MGTRVSRHVAAGVLLFGLVAGCKDDETDPPTGGAGGGDEGGQGGEGGDAEGAGGEGGGGAGYEGPCTPLTLGDTQVFFESWGKAAVAAPVSPLVEDLASTRITMELYDYDFTTGMPLPPIVPGTFPFETPPDD